MIKTYITIPEEVQVTQFEIFTLGEIIGFTNCTNFQLSQNGGVYQCSLTVNNGQKMLVVEKDYIVKDKNNMISVLKPSVFENQYIEKV